MIASDGSECWYFAYGSNLLQTQMRERTSEVREPKVVRLPNWRLAFNKRGDQGGIFANIVPQEGAEVWGVIYRCSPGAMDKLDVFEGVVGGDYHHQRVEVIDREGAKVRAVAYVAGDDHLCPEGKPADAYLRKILRAADEHGLPPDYVKQIVALAAGDLKSCSDSAI